MDHIVPRALADLDKAEHRDNLLEICTRCHGRKARAENRLHRGDVLGFWQELQRQGWPMAKVRRALEMNGYGTGFAA